LYRGSGVSNTRKANNVSETEERIRGLFSVAGRVVNLPTQRVAAQLLDEHSPQTVFQSVIPLENYYWCMYIFKYKVPEYLPINKDIKLEIEVIKPDNEFEHLYGKQKLCIKKRGR
jgi:hypothetical protein